MEALRGLVWTLGAIMLIGIALQYPLAAATAVAVGFVMYLAVDPR